MVKQNADFSLSSRLKLLASTLCSVQMKTKQRYTGRYNIKIMSCYRRVQEVAKAQSVDAASNRPVIQDVARGRAANK